MRLFEIPQLYYIGTVVADHNASLWRIVDVEEKKHSMDTRIVLMRVHSQEIRRVSLYAARDWQVITIDESRPPQA